MKKSLFTEYEIEQTPFPCFNVTLTKLMTSRLQQTYQMCNPNEFLKGKENEQAPYDDN